MTLKQLMDDSDFDMCWGLALEVDFLTEEERWTYAYNLYQAIKWAKSH